MNARDGFRMWWLVRQVDESRTYVLDAYVKTDRHEVEGQVVFESTVAGMEDRIFGSSETNYNSEIEALELLNDLLGSAISNDRVLESFDNAKGLNVRLVNVPFDQMVETLETLTKTLGSEPTREVKQKTASDGGWSLHPASEAQAELCSTP